MSHLQTGKIFRRKIRVISTKLNIDPIATNDIPPRSKSKYFWLIRKGDPGDRNEFCSYSLNNLTTPTKIHNLVLYSLK